jgi:hypothetical protein
MSRWALAPVLPQGSIPSSPQRSIRDFIPLALETCSHPLGNSNINGIFDLEQWTFPKLLTACERENNEFP